MAIGPALYSSQFAEWATPPEFFAKLDAEFHFTLDTCASAENAKCARYFTREQDALRQIWDGIVFCNPPYGRDIGLWFAKARMEAHNGATVVMLAHARTDTRWWHGHVEGIADKVRFVKGRLKFLNPAPCKKHGVRNCPKHSAPFPSTIIIYRPNGEHHANRP